MADLGIYEGGRKASLVGLPDLPGRPIRRSCGGLCPTVLCRTVAGGGVLSTCFSSVKIFLSLYSDILQMCNLCLGPKNIQVYFVFLLFLSNRLDNFLFGLL